MLVPVALQDVVAVHLICQNFLLALGGAVTSLLTDAPVCFLKLVCVSIIQPKRGWGTPLIFCFLKFVNSVPAVLEKRIGPHH